MKIYNTMKREIEEVRPRKEGKINMFVCGPTVYDDIHVGNARTFVFFDSFAKYLRYRGFMVMYVQNITDIDDKIINRANEEGVSSEVISKRYFHSFMENMKRLRVDSVSVFAPSSKFIQEIIQQIRTLEEKGFAYMAEDGVYFRVNRFADYGGLSGQKIDQLKPGARVQTAASKESFSDFVLWKLRKPGEPYWDSPWGEGRPGWHIEDTAITEYFFGPVYDIHGGGSDLVFPHHEAEIAQMRSISGEESLSDYWIHTGMLNMTEEKMSKSTGNIIRLGMILEKFSPEDLRFFFLNSLYRSTLEFSAERIAEASASRSKIQNLYDRLESVDREKGDYDPEIQKMQKNMVKYLDEDFDSRSFIRDLLEFSSVVFRNFELLDTDTAEEIRNYLDEVDSVFGIISRKRASADISILVSRLLELRNRLRNEKRYDESDEIRAILNESGITVEDTAKLTEWRA